MPHLHVSNEVGRCSRIDELPLTTIATWNAALGQNAPFGPSRCPRCCRRRCSGRCTKSQEYPPRPVRFARPGARFLPSPRSARHTRSRKACVRNPGPNIHKRFGTSGVMRSSAAAVACTRVRPRRARRIIVEKKKTVSYHHRIVRIPGTSVEP